MVVDALDKLGYDSRQAALPGFCLPCYFSLSGPLDQGQAELRVGNLWLRSHAKLGGLWLDVLQWCWPFAALVLAMWQLLVHD